MSVEHKHNPVSFKQKFLRPFLGMALLTSGIVACQPEPVKVLQPNITTPTTSDKFENLKSITLNFSTTNPRVVEITISNPTGNKTTLLDVVGIVIKECGLNAITALNNQYGVYGYTLVVEDVKCNTKFNDPLPSSKPSRTPTE